MDLNKMRKLAGLPLVESKVAEEALEEAKKEADDKEEVAKDKEEVAKDKESKDKDEEKEAKAEEKEAKDDKEDKEDKKDVKESLGLFKRLAGIVEEDIAEDADVYICLEGKDAKSLQIAAVYKSAVSAKEFLKRAKSAVKKVEARKFTK